MADYLQTLRMRNMFPGTEAPPANFGGDGYMPGAEQFGMDMPSQGGYGGNMNGGNMFQPLQNEYMPDPSYGPSFTGPTNTSPYGADEGYGMDFMGPMQGPETSDYNVDQRMNQLYDPQHQQGDRLNDLLGQYPQRPTPLTGWRGGLQKIGAVAGGMTGGMGLYNEVMAPGYSNKVADWKGQTGPTQQAAQIERQNNVNERQSAMGTISAELRNQAMQHKAKNDEVRSQIAQQRADAYDFKSRNPNLKLIMTKGGNVMSFDPQTGETADLGIPTGSLTQADQMALAQKNALEKIAATGEEGRETAALRGDIEATNIGLRGDESRKTKSTASGTLSNSRQEAPNQTRIRETDAARKIRNTRPDLARFLKFDTNGFTIMPSTEAGRFTGAKGPTPEQRAEMESIIYGKPKIGPPNSSNANEPPAPPGYRYVRKPGGGWTAVKQ